MKNPFKIQTDKGIIEITDYTVVSLYVGNVQEKFAIHANETGKPALSHWGTGYRVTNLSNDDFKVGRDEMEHVRAAKVFLSTITRERWDKALGGKEVINK
jgi:hypothetical protein